jgi:hypothetical protein
MYSCIVTTHIRGLYFGDDIFLVGVGRSHCHDDLQRCWVHVELIEFGVQRLAPLYISSATLLRARRMVVRFGLLWVPILIFYSSLWVLASEDPPL